MTLELFNRLISHCDLNNDQTLKFGIYLWNLSLTNQSTTKFHVISTKKI
jgi:hypothetical protein